MKLIKMKDVSLTFLSLTVKKQPSSNFPNLKMEIILKPKRIKVFLVLSRTIHCITFCNSLNVSKKKEINPYFHNFQDAFDHQNKTWYQWKTDQNQPRYCYC